ncbi:bacteriocin fulvocin C-related protein [Siphonobacter sp. SORGH_AS_1065]|uniref:bacteriocin fulvocin C-related protein n=1 Tax=Siphonobacter sp. SORGH_AS_1065 TaxID=3041795 RepID=UPI0027821422|nr:bacteriocin fulvocin C-related protein [Siphonobacter sp. SORGH_AS_1065]MDQ1086534.1 hypothetical protein [Siphonobacter sp. SORGH_AS_1065]
MLITLMKKGFYITLASLTLLLSGCSENNYESSFRNTLQEKTSEQYLNQLRNSIDESKLDQMLALKSLPAKKSFYINTLNSGERYYFWVRKFNHYASLSDATAEQKALLKELVSHLKPEFFSNPAQGNQFAEGYMAEWNKKALTAFDKGNLATLTSTLEYTR